ncbi:unnamed protein product [Ceratitis capitata]|uniref:(Mediterranean fruit fly) hypothetical protein n=1 Tax=Ceratitis capitata TaxID=7213 RepID=A0A811UHW8_CERCA|nr:unnamed protein product [Ceratitis capitata]
MKQAPHREVLDLDGSGSTCRPSSPSTSGSLGTKPPSVFVGGEKPLCFTSESAKSYFTKASATPFTPSNLPAVDDVTGGDGPSTLNL